jgi:hypothetical protein
MQYKILIAEEMQSAAVLWSENEHTRIASIFRVEEYAKKKYLTKSRR